ncbi:MAG: hypothetical protein ACLGJC_26655 [Alphaproteobacteria bacterium]
MAIGIRMFANITILAASLTVALAASTPALAQFRFLFSEHARGEFTPEDWDLFKGAMRRILEQGTVGSRADWKNDNTGFDGDMEVERNFDREGLPCHQVAFAFRRAGREVPYRMNFCKTEQGEWVIAP